MPSRIFRDGLLTSVRFNSIPWREQNFFLRLLLVVDDFACYDAHPMVLRAALFPLAIDKMSTADVSSCLRACEEAGLVSTYYVDNHPYLFIPNFRNQCRAKKRKYPPPPDPAPEHAEQMLSNCLADAQHLYTKYEDNNVQNNTGTDYYKKNNLVVDKTTLIPDASAHTSTTTTTPQTPHPPAAASRAKAFSEWLARVCAVRPLLAEMSVLPPNVLAAAKVAFLACPKAPDFAPELKRYYAADDTLVPYPPYYRPTSYEKFFSQLADIIEHARAWCIRDNERAAAAARKAARAARKAEQTKSQAKEIPDPRDVRDFRAFCRDFSKS